MRICAALLVLGPLQAAMFSLEPGCVDVPGWTNGESTGHMCEGYERTGWCADGSATPKRVDARRKLSPPGTQLLRVWEDRGWIISQTEPRPVPRAWD